MPKFDLKLKDKNTNKPICSVEKIVVSNGGPQL